MNTPMFKLSLAAFVLAIAVVVLGAFTRLADAGLGCPDWPTCYGHLWVPSSEADVAAANSRFVETPVEHDKTWPEQLHRIFASTLGLVILGIFYLAYKNATHPSRRSILVCLSCLVAATVARIFSGAVLDPLLWVLVITYFLNVFRVSRVQGADLLPQSGPVLPFKLPVILAGLVILQGLFGMWTVTLKLWPKVVTLHLLGGFTTLSLLWVLVQRLGGWRWPSVASGAAALLPLARVVVVLVIVQIALGGWVSSNYAALACPDFPLCQNSLWPDAKFVEGFNLFQAIGPNYLGGLLESEARVAIHLSHRVGALLVFIASVLLVFNMLRHVSAEVRRMAMILIVVLLMQVSLGVMNIVLSLPLAIAVAHNAGGAILLLTIITVNLRLQVAEKNKN